MCEGGGYTAQQQRRRRRQINPHCTVRAASRHGLGNDFSPRNLSCTGRTSRYSCQCAPGNVASSPFCGCSFCRTEGKGLSYSTEDVVNLCKLSWATGFFSFRCVRVNISPKVTGIVLQSKFSDLIFLFQNACQYVRNTSVQTRTLCSVDTRRSAESVTNSPTSTSPHQKPTIFQLVDSCQSSISLGGGWVDSCQSSISLGGGWVI